MAAAVKMVITGDKKVNALLKGLPIVMQRKIIREAARESIKPLLPLAQLAAPRRSGALERSMAVRAVVRSRKRIGARITNRQGNLFKGREFYGGFQEWGWKTGKRKGRRGRGTVDPVTLKLAVVRYKDNKPRRKIAGKFFLKTTTDRNRPTVLRYYRNLIKQKVDLYARTTT